MMPSFFRATHALHIQSCAENTKLGDNNRNKKQMDFQSSQENLPGLRFIEVLRIHPKNNLKSDGSLKIWDMLGLLCGVLCKEMSNKDQ